ncbi:MAG: PorT family protein [Chitinophagaceae bacterium]|nr:MAG: PorT family protein [Chitinophagaceae bacterium]
MKKIILASCFSLLSLGAFAQLEIGVKVTPNLGWNRIDGSNESAGYEGDGSRMHLNGGLVLDKFFGDNYAFSTGLLLATKGGTLSYPLLGTSIQSVDIMNQYLEIPVSLKLYTNEVAPDIKAYFQLGGAFGFLTAAKIDGEKNIDIDGPGGNETEKATKSFNTVELSALLGAGIEYQLGESTKVFTGLAFQHGLTDISDKKLGGDDLSMKNSMLGLDFGIKF